MPVVFVLIWSTGFIVARYGMPHSPPMKFLALRYFLSVACFALWAWAAKAAMPSSRDQVKHLAVTGILMHAGYLGGVWAAVKLGMGAGLVALLVGLQPVLTAAATKLAATKSVEEWLIAASETTMGEALRAAGQAAAFACGLELLPPVNVQLSSPTYQRSRFESMERQLTERRSAGQLAK